MLVEAYAADEIARIERSRSYRQPLVTRPDLSRAAWAPRRTLATMLISAGCRIADVDDQICRKLAEPRPVRGAQVS